jgi:hypothetical protein
MCVRLVNVLFLTAIFLLGTTVVALTPPFEAFDEAFYWSAVQQTADTGIIPSYGEAFIARDAEAYPGPLPSSNGQPYSTWLQAGVNTGSVRASGPSSYIPGRMLNYEAQHPPLFFVVMALPYRAAAVLSWPLHMFALRMVCWTIAFIGFAWGALVTQAALRRRQVPDVLLLLPLSWPLVFPQFFPEFTRITNDTVCVLLMAALWHGLIRWLDHGASWRRALMLGVVLSLGLLTKAFFLPVTAGVACLLVLVASRRTQDWQPVLLVLVCAVAIGGPWYLSRWLATNVWTGAVDSINVENQGGLLVGLREHFSLSLYGLGLLRMVGGFCWAGTWSFVHTSRGFVVPVALLILWPLGRYLSGLRHSDPMAWAPVFIVGPVFAGLLYHLLGMVAVGHVNGGTPGWFFHIFAAPLSLAWVLGWPRSRLTLPLLAYSGVFGLVMIWMQAAFFSGCLPRVGLDQVKLTKAICLVDVTHLRLFALPYVAGASLMLALLALGCAAWCAARLARATTKLTMSPGRHNGR